MHARVKFKHTYAVNAFIPNSVTFGFLNQENTTTEQHIQTIFF